MEKFYLTKSIVPRGTTTETQPQQLVGVPTLGNTTYNITNEYANSEIIYINITNLLALTSETVNKEALYLTFSSGSEEEGWHTGGTFTYKTYTYDDGTFMRWFDSIEEFVAVSAEMAEAAETSKNNPFEPMPSNIYIFKSFSSSTSKKIVQGSNYGIWLGNVENYKLEDGKLVKQNFINAYGVTSPDISISVPYAYEQDGHYHGGCLDDSDYAMFKKSSGITIDTVIPTITSNEHVPSTKLVNDLFVKKSIKLKGVWKITNDGSSYSYTEIYKSSNDFFLNIPMCSGHVLAIEFTSMPTKQQLQEFMKMTNIEYTILLDSNNQQNHSTTICQIQKAQYTNYFIYVGNNNVNSNESYVAVTFENLY